MAVRSTTDQVAARKLARACGRLDRAITTGNERRAEQCRADVVQAMADLLDEFGVACSEAVRDALPEFDGRHLDDTESAPEVNGEAVA